MSLPLHSKPFLSAKGLKIGYNRKSLLESFNLEVEPQSFLAIVGSNGSGKTTLLRTLLGLQKPISGQIKKSPDVRFGYVPQKSAVNMAFPLTVAEVVMLGRVKHIGIFRRPSPQDHHAVIQALKDVSLEHLANHLIHTLSGGQYQRMMIARALASEPSILVLDEPTTGMDMVAEHDFISLVQSLKLLRSLTVIMVTHDLASAAECSDSLMVINGQDHSVTVGVPLEVLNNKRLSTLFHRAVKVVKAEGRITFIVGDGSEDEKA